MINIRHGSRPYRRLWSADCILNDSTRFPSVVSKSKRTGPRVTCDPKRHRGQRISLVALSVAIFSHIYFSNPPTWQRIGLLSDNGVCLLVAFVFNPSYAIHRRTAYPVRSACNGNLFPDLDKTVGHLQLLRNGLLRRFRPRHYQ